MTLRHLRIFMEVCRFGSITQAAEELNMAQPAVSYAIRELESYYETRLFERMNRRLYITESGEQLMNYADSILGQFDEVKNVLKDVNMVTKIRIGANVSYGMSKLPELISKFRTEHSKIPVYIRVENSAQIEEELVRNSLDFGIIDYPARSEFFFCSLLEEEAVTIACSPKLHIPSELQMRDLKDIPLLLRENGSGLRNIMEQVMKNMKKEDIKPIIAMESVSTQCLINACVEGMGIFAVQKNSLQPYLENGKLKEIKIKGAKLTRQYYLVYHKSKFLTKSMKAFRKCALDEHR